MKNCAALIMAEIRAFAKRDFDPANILKRLNEELISDLDDKKYVTLIIARINPYRNILDDASAGHIPAYLVDNKGRIKHILNPTGIPSGFISGENFLSSEQIALKPGDILALLTDGITEAIANDENEFGFTYTIDLINKYRMDTA